MALIYKEIIGNKITSTSYTIKSNSKIIFSSTGKDPIDGSTQVTYFNNNNKQSTFNILNTQNINKLLNLLIYNNEVIFERNKEDNRPTTVNIAGNGIIRAYYGDITLCKLSYSVENIDGATPGTISCKVNGITRESHTQIGNIYIGSNILLTAKSNTGYEFEKWIDETGTQLATTATYNFEIKEDTTYIAVFKKKIYDIIMSVNPSGSGDAVATMNGSIISKCTHGSSISLSATAGTGYTFNSWSADVDGALSSDVSPTNSYRATTVNPTESTDSITYTAHFSRKTYQITLTIGPTGAGTVTGAGTYSHGNTATLRATPNTGYEFKYWSKGGTEVSRNNPYEFDVTANGTYAANFRKIESGEEEGDATGDGKIATNADIYNKTAQIYELNNNQCPTKQTILNKDGDVITINGNYTNEQCVKYSDINTKITITGEVHNNVTTDIANFEIKFGFGPVEDGAEIQWFKTFYASSGSTIGSGESVSFAKELDLSTISHNMPSYDDNGYDVNNILYLGFSAPNWGHPRVVKFEFLKDEETYKYNFKSEDLIETEMPCILIDINAGRIEYIESKRFLKSKDMFQNISITVTPD